MPGRGDREEPDERHGPDRGDPVVVALTVEQLAKEWHETCCEHAAKQQLIDRIRHVVGEVECVGECGLSDDDSEHHEADQSRHAGHRRARGDDEVGTDEARHVRTHRRALDRSIRRTNH